MRTKLEVIQLDRETWELYVDGAQTGQYASAAGGKAAARRRISSHAKRLEWTQCSAPGDPLEHWVAYGNL